MQVASFSTYTSLETILLGVYPNDPPHEPEFWLHALYLALLSPQSQCWGWSNHERSDKTLGLPSINKPPHSTAWLAVHGGFPDVPCGPYTNSPQMSAPWQWGGARNWGVDRPVCTHGSQERSPQGWGSWSRDVCCLARMAKCICRLSAEEQYSSVREAWKRKGHCLDQPQQQKI